MKRWLEEMCRQDTPPHFDAQFMAQGPEFFRGAPEVYAYLQWRSTVVASLMREVHSAVGGRSKLYFLSLLPHSRSWLFGVDLKTISALCEGVVVCCYDSTAGQAQADLAESRREFAPGAHLLAGMRCFVPEYADITAFAEKVRAARQEGVDGFLFYNYGLIPPAHLRWARTVQE